LYIFKSLFEKLKKILKKSSKFAFIEFFGF
jgi:hypothetical protein